MKAFNSFDKILIPETIIAAEKVLINERVSTNILVLFLGKKIFIKTINLYLLELDCINNMCA
jgi:hypothetical protein